MTSIMVFCFFKIMKSLFHEEKVGAIRVGGGYALIILSSVTVLPFKDGSTSVPIAIQGPATVNLRIDELKDR